MNKLRPVAVAVVGTVVAVAAAYAVFAGVLVGSDVASYTSDGVTVPDLAYELSFERCLVDTIGPEIGGKDVLRGVYGIGGTGE
ncbi:hypothetical protein [Halorubrum sp. SD612]|uniref:hypothetical protein n=1 Tax=Halorubrum sp. SD612 TaxID=1855863 RepID=UPI00117A3AA4|nr:hypothetical protein [Halorubrum sp. SD612]